MAITIAILASGRGSNFKAIAQAVRSHEIKDAKIIALITHNPSSGSIETAKLFQIDAILLTEPDRQKYNTKLRETLLQLAPDWICLAGYLRILPKEIVHKFPDRIVNIHPSLLPAFPGLNAQRKALQAKERITGCTVHLVTEGMDEGPIVAQSTCEISDNDTEESLIAKLLPLEHLTYVTALNRLIHTPFVVKDNKIVWEAKK